MSQPIEIPDSVDELARRWEGRDPASWGASEEIYRAFGRRAVTLGRPALAVDILNEGLERFPGDPDLAYGASLALANCGSLSQAGQRIGALLDRLPAGSPILTDAVSLAGRIAKERWSKIPDTAEGRESLERAAEFYGRAHQISRDPFPGINAASMLLLGGQRDRSLEIAREVKSRCLALPAPARDHWTAATLGEACLLLGEPAESAGWYRRAVEAAGSRLGDVASMRRQLRLLGRILTIAPEIEEAVAIPHVGMFVGHMIDAPDRPEPRFPPGLEGAVEQAIGRAIDESRIGIGYSSLACGADILFVEQMRRRGHEINVVLPFRREDFVRTSVAVGGARWVERFERALDLATHTSYAVDEGYLGDRILFDYTARLLQGAAMLRARQLSSDPYLVAVVDEAAGGTTGGSLATLQGWRSLGEREVVIDLASLRAGAPAAPSTAAAEPAPAGFEIRSEIWGRRTVCTMLFADMVGFSRLAETEAPSFIVHFLGRTARVIRSASPGPVFWNTWGDGLFLVFDDVEDAGRFALRLRDAIVKHDWESAGLPRETSIRIAMHTGPVFPAEDPIIGRRNFFGSHVNRAARIEPVTAAGAVYVSEQTAALLAASGSRELAVDYLGEKVLAKSFGTRTLYRLRHAHAAE